METKMIWVILGVGLVACAVEALGDRHGESKSGKLKDAIWLTIVALSVSLFACYRVDVNPLKTIALLLGVRVLVFDYLVSYLLIKNDVIVGHWFTYTGKTSRWDKLISRIPPWVRFVLRLLVFVAAFLAFLLK